ncbi:hypothetical protein [Kitasatospora griseola]
MSGTRITLTQDVTAWSADSEVVTARMDDGRTQFLVSGPTPQDAQFKPAT